MINEKVQWSGGRLWADQIEEDFEEGEIPNSAQGEEESTCEEQEDADQSVNGKALISNTNATKNNEKNLENKGEGEAKGQ